MILEHSQVVNYTELHSVIAPDFLSMDSVDIVEQAWVSLVGVAVDAVMKQAHTVAGIEVVHASMVGIAVDTAVAELESGAGWEDLVENLLSEDFALGQVSPKIESRASPSVAVAAAAVVVVVVEVHSLVPFELFPMMSLDS